MKKIIAAILCLVLLFSMASCANSAKDDAAETDATGAVQASYEDIIEKYDEFLNLKINKKRLPELVESSPEAIKVVRKIVDECKTPLDMGYAEKDINGDGTDELILMRVTLDIAAIFTVKNGDAVVLSRKKVKMAPGEMESLTLKASLLEGVSELLFALEVE